MTAILFTIIVLALIGLNVYTQRQHGAERRRLMAAALAPVNQAGAVIALAPDKPKGEKKQPRPVNEAGEEIPTRPLGI